MSEVNSIVIPRWFDRHLHIRRGDMMKTIFPCTLNQRATGAVIMPNVKDHEVVNASRAWIYYQQILDLIPAGVDFTPVMTLYLTDDISPKDVVEGFKAGAWKAVKLYMANQDGGGGTTGSHLGVKNLLGRYKVFEAMQEHKIPLLGHFEAVEEGTDEFDREQQSVDRDLLPLLSEFTKLPVVVEHITDGYTADVVAQSSSNVYATITAHHLMVNRNAMFWVPGKGRGMNPINYCLPVAKREEDRLKIRGYATSGNPRFGAGTDSAPHDEEAKARCYGCAAGIFTAPNAVELYATVFDEDNALQHLGGFLSEHFLHIYGMEKSKETMTIIREPLDVPQKVGSVWVFKGGTQLPLKLV